jgi:hypothetical protein
MADCVRCGCPHHESQCDIIHSPAETECACPMCMCSDCVEN